MLFQPSSEVIVKRQWNASSHHSFHFFLNFSLSSSYAAYKFFSVRFQHALSKFFFLRKKIFCFLCSLLCCNTHSKIHVAATQLRLKNISEKNELYVMYDWIHKISSRVSCMFLYFLVIDKKFYVSLNERLAIKYVYAIIIKGSWKQQPQNPFFSSCMCDLLLELCFRVNDDKKNLSRNTKNFKARHAYTFAAYKQYEC